MTIKELSKKYSELMVNKEFERDNNKFERIIIKENIPEADRKFLLDLTFKVSEETQLDMDSVYEFTSNSLDAINDICKSKDEPSNDKIRDLSYDYCEATPYTGNLTEWLNQSCNNVFYLTQAIEEYNPKDGFQALSIAQSLAKQEVLNIVLNFLEEKAEVKQ